jgi:hypothetical protein
MNHPPPSAHSSFNQHQQAHHNNNPQSMAAGIQSQPYSSAMAGYGQSPVNGNMQVMNHYDQRAKTSQQPQGASASNASSQHYQSGPAHYHGNYGYDAANNGRSRSANRNGEDDAAAAAAADERRRRSRSNNRSSSRHRSSNSSSNNPPSTYDYRNPGSTPQDNQFTGYNSTHSMSGVANNVTPPSPPPDASVVTNSQTQLDATQRRPAYLLHRDLVIGKGSYGQVCIASRGEAEGHVTSSSSNGKSGKRKKFACKCVMLRNDPKYIAKLQEEVNVLRELRGHDNVIRLYDVFCVDNELFIITELGRGGDLFHLLTTHPKHGVTEGYAGEFVVVVTVVQCCCWL